MSRVLVIGAAGLVGGALLRAWEERGAQVWGADRQAAPRLYQLDMRDEGAVRAALKQIEPGIVAVPAANAHVDYCELHPEETRRVNVEGVLNVARACRETGARMVFFSSEYVFDGARGVYREEDPPSPLSEYGRQKVEAEAGVLAASAANLVIRTTSVYGWQKEPKNFILQVLKELSAGNHARVICDTRVSPTYAENLARITAELTDGAAAGVYHMVGADHLSRYDFALLLAQTFGLDAALIQPCPSSQFQAPARRPQDALLLTDKVRRVVSTPIIGVRQGLESMCAAKEAWLTNL